jgi:hypothetical protein
VQLTATHLVDCHTAAMTERQRYRNISLYDSTSVPPSAQPSYLGTESALTVTVTCHRPVRACPTGLEVPERMAISRLPHGMLAMAPKADWLIPDRYRTAVRP